MDKSIKKSESEWTAVITANKSFLSFNLGEIWSYRDLIYMLTRRDVVSRYKQTVLGPAWYFIQPLATTVVFVIVFGQIAGLPTDGVPQFLFYMAGNICWSYFSNCFKGASETFMGNVALFGKVYFPRLTVPISMVITHVVGFAIQLLMFFGFAAYYVYLGMEIQLNWSLLYFPALVIQIGLVSLGAGILISALTTKYRDLGILVSFGIQLWMYATPIVYPFSSVPEKYQFIYMLNPMSSITEAFKYVLLGVGSFDPLYLAMGWGVTIVLFFFGAGVFGRTEKTFVDTI